MLVKFCFTVEETEEIKKKSDTEIIIRHFMGSSELIKRVH